MGLESWGVQPPPVGSGPPPPNVPRTDPRPLPQNEESGESDEVELSALAEELSEEPDESEAESDGADSEADDETAYWTQLEAIRQEQRRLGGASKGRLERLNVEGEGASAEDSELLPDADLEAVLRAMILQAPSDEVISRLAHELEPVGVGLYRYLHTFGVRIVIVAAGQPLSAVRIGNYNVVAKGGATFDGRDWESIRGLYHPGEKLLLLGEERIASSLGRSTPLHETGHALDDAYTVLHYRKTPLSVELWEKGKGGRRGLVTPYAGSSPGEHFAESFEAYFLPTLRERLEEVDPPFVEALGVLLQSFN